MARRGRPIIKCEAHPHRSGIILQDAQLRFAHLRPEHNGKTPSARAAADHAAFATMTDGFHHTGPLQKLGPPPKVKRGASLRNSPSSKSNQDGYTEYVVQHQATPALTGAYFDSASQTIRQTREIWRKRRQARRWLSNKSFQLARVIYPTIPSYVLRREHLKTR